MSSSDPSPGLPTPHQYPATFGRFTLLSLLGDGAMGRVFEAEMEGPEGRRRRVALKVLLPDPEAGDRFRAALVREARIGALMHHPNIVETYDSGETDGVPWIAMELVSGVTLLQILQNRRPEPAQVLEIATQLLGALDFAHTFTHEGRSGEVVHRDLKPGNVLLTRTGQLKLVDFGIAKAKFVSGMTTASGMTKGTPLYMSPEQTRGLAVDGRSDVFAVGALLAEMVTGHPLFMGSTVFEVVTAVADVEHHLENSEVLSLAEAAVPGLERVLRGCLREDRSLRTDSAATLRDQLLDLISSVRPAPTLGALVAEVDFRAEASALQGDEDEAAATLPSPMRANFEAPEAAPSGAWAAESRARPLTRPQSRVPRGPAPRSGPHWPGLLLSGGVMLAVAAVVVWALTRV